MHIYVHARTQACTHTHTQPFYGPLGFCLGVPRWASIRKVKPGRENQSWFTGVRDSEWQWHRLGHMQICTLIQTHNHVSIPPLSLLFDGTDALLDAQPTASKHGRQLIFIPCVWISMKIKKTLLVFPMILINIIVPWRYDPSADDTHRKAANSTYTPWAIKKRAPFIFSITLANIDGFS